jgi:hypothetical protein
VVISLWFICSSLLSLVISLLMLSLPIWCDVSCQVPLISLWGLWWMSLWSLWGLFFLVLWLWGLSLSSVFLVKFSHPALSALSDWSPSLFCATSGSSYLLWTDSVLIVWSPSLENFFEEYT